MQEPLRQESFRCILNIQELDMKMIRLIRLRKARKKELEQIAALRLELDAQLKEKQKEIEELSINVVSQEQKLEEVTAKIKKLESQQGNVKKVDEFNAITQELTSAERERIVLEQKMCDLVDKRLVEEEILEKIRESLKTSEESSRSLEKEIANSILLINEEGNALKAERDALVQEINPELYRIYERLLHNKKDRVIVPIENRTCTGCHIVVTAQHENLVRKAANIVFCEHCSRIHYWQDQEDTEAAATAGRRRRRKAAVS